MGFVKAPLATACAVITVVFGVDGVGSECRMLITRTPRSVTLLDVNLFSYRLKVKSNKI